MPTVRITTSWGHAERMEWAGATDIDAENHIERSLAIPEEGYKRIESAVIGGHIEGDVYLEDKSRFQCFLDRSAGWRLSACCYSTPSQDCSSR